MLHAAVDLGAGSGRVFLGAIDDRRVHLQEVHRFSYSPRRVDGHLRWNIQALLDGLRAGLGRAHSSSQATGAELHSIGVDGWGVDYALLDDHGRLVEEPVCYRDDRTSGVMERALAVVTREALFAATGTQLLPFNTVFQLMAHVAEGVPQPASQLLFIPDLCHHALCGSTTGEHTNASTSQLLNVTTGQWDDGLFSALGLPRQLMPELRAAGSELGSLRESLQRELAMPPVRVVQPATHDTASAVIGTPLSEGWAFISSGTWSLVGIERSTPLLDAAALDANFTNERGVNGSFRLLKNVMGLWILDSCRREWQAAGVESDLARLLAGAAASGEVDAVVYPDAQRFFYPPSMVRELHQALAASGQRVPDDPVVLTKVILDSLALRYASVVETLESLTGSPVRGLHIVGGGACNDYLNQATANSTGRPVLAGPVEATVLGNLLMQSVASGSTTLSKGRRAIASAMTPRRFEPKDTDRWKAAHARYRALETASSRPAPS
jgi:rhamnulokinase